MRSMPLGSFAGLLAGLFLAAPSAFSDEARFELGLRINIVGADGEPSNDQLGAGLLARYRLNERWRLGLAFDQASGFDVEEPANVLGIPTDPASEPIDASGDSTHVQLWIERVYTRPGGRLEWFWAVGAGAGQVDVDGVVGPRPGGGSYNIVQEVGTELLATGQGGLRVRLGERWALEAALRLDQHFTDWQVRDTVSGRSGNYDDYLVRGIHFGVVVRF